MTIGIVVAIIIVVIGLAVIGVLTSRKVPVAVGGDDAEFVMDPEAWPGDDGSEARLIPRDPEITWPSRLSSGAPMDDDARLRLIRDLGLIRAAWVVPILTQAAQEERKPEHRDAVRQALAACEQREGSATTELTTSSSDS
jgi:hypothetical protein